MVSLSHGVSQKAFGGSLEEELQEVEKTATRIITQEASSILIFIGFDLLQI
jgi:hypothetical protein